VTDQFIQAISDETIEIPDFLSAYKTAAISLVKRVYDADNYNSIENYADEKKFPGEPNENI